MTYLIYLSSFFVYLLTIGPSFNLLDSPEFIAFAYRLDIPHPPGHPLYPLLGKLLSFIPFGSIALKVNLLSAIFASLTAIIIYYLIHTFLEISFKKKLTTSDDIIKTSSFVSTISIIFTYPFWIQAVRAEVYSLNSFFVSLLIFLLIRFIYYESLDSRFRGNDKNRANNILDSLSVTTDSSDVIPDSIGNLTNFNGFNKKHLVPPTPRVLPSQVGIKGGARNKNFPQLQSKDLFIFSFVLGLAYCNHTLAITLLLPAFLFLLVFRKKKVFKEIKLLSIALIFFFVGLSIYLYLPARSSTQLYFDWGNPDSLERIITVVSGSQYKQSFSFPDKMQLINNFKNHFSLFSDQLTYSFTLFALIGLIFLIKKDFCLSLFTLILFIIGLAGTVLQAKFISTNPDSHGYLFTSFLVISVWLSHGIYILLSILYTLTSRLSKTRSLKASTERDKTNLSRVAHSWNNKWVLKTCSILLLLTPITIFSISYSYVDRSDSYFPQVFTKKILSSLRPNSIIFSRGDTIIFPFWYYQVCENRYQSLIMIEQSSFFNFTEAKKVLSKYKDKIEFPPHQLVDYWIKTLPAENFNDEGEKEPFPPWIKKLFKEIVFLNIDAYNIYYQKGKLQLLPTNFLLPHSIIYQVQKDSLNEINPDDLQQIKDFWNWMKKQLSVYPYLSYDINIKKLYSNQYYNAGNYFYHFKNYDNAITLYKNSIELQPKVAHTHINLALCYMMFGLFDEAIRESRIGIDLEPDNATAYSNLGSIYLEKKDYKNAEINILKALELNPKHKTARENYKKVMSLKKNNEL